MSRGIELRVAVVHFEAERAERRGHDTAAVDAAILAAEERIVAAVEVAVFALAVAQRPLHRLVPGFPMVAALLEHRQRRVVPVIKIARPLRGQVLGLLHEIARTGDTWGFGFFAADQQT